MFSVVPTGLFHGAFRPRTASWAKFSRPCWTQASLASRVISVLFLKSLEMGQLFFASWAALSNAALSAPGTLAVVANRILVMVGPASIFSNVTVALVSIDSGGKLAVVSWALSAIVKQPA